MNKNGQYVGVDEKYIPEEEKYVDNTLNGEIKDALNDGVKSVKNYVSKDENKEKIKNAGKKGLGIIKGIGIGYLCFIGFVFIMAIIIFIMAFSNIFKSNQRADKIYNSIENRHSEIIDKTIN